MPTPYFALNTLAGATRADTTVKEVTTAGRFDSAYVPNSIQCPSAGHSFDVAAPFWDGSSSLAGTIYLRFDVIFQGSAANGDNPLTIFNAGANAYRIQNSSGTTFQMQYWNSGSSAWVNWGSTFTLANTTLMTLRLKLVVNSSFEIKNSGGTVLASSAVVPTNGATAVTLFRFSTTNATVATDFSQIMCSDTETLDSHYMIAAFNGDSATNTSGSGAYTTINETPTDDSTAVLLAAAGKRGQTKASLTIPGGYAIAGLVMNARGRVSGGTITVGKLGVRSSGTNYPSSDKAFGSTYGPRGNIWQTDPATGVAFSQAGFNNAETYLEAA